MNLLLEEIHGLSSLSTPEEKVARMQAILRECKQIDYYRLLSVSSHHCGHSIKWPQLDKAARTD